MKRLEFAMISILAIMVGIIAIFLTVGPQFESINEWKKCEAELPESGHPVIALYLADGVLEPDRVVRFVFYNLDGMLDERWFLDKDSVQVDIGRPAYWYPIPGKNDAD